MKISDILRFMGIEYSLRGDREYSGDIEIESLDADWPQGMPLSEDFHAAASSCSQKMAEDERLAEKRASYPDMIDWLLAITGQIVLMTNGDARSAEFSDLLNKIDEINAKFS